MTVDEVLAAAQTDKALAAERAYLTSHLKTFPTRTRLSSYEPKREWFTVSPDGLHGIMHETRVLVHAELLGNIEYATGKHVDIDALRYAAITHDVKRINDWYDFPHGGRAATWIKETMPIPAGHCGTVADIVKWHVTQDIAIPKMTKELELFKDADGLDRWRIGDLNENYLRTFHAANMVQTARYLYLLSTELSKEKGADRFAAVLEAGRLLGIIL
ncbi:hypothetical protein HY639_00920 [Candidatus Woesearchaeota archaeon]|nr:hypothetical protein [Candidatus Woesearchaeota archaeon]